MSLLTKLTLFFKTRVSGYYTREGKWVELHYDKRPVRNPEDSPSLNRKPSNTSRTSDQATIHDQPADLAGQLNLLSILETPQDHRAVPKRAAKQVNAQVEAAEPSRSSEQSEIIRTSGTSPEPSASPHAQGMPSAEPAIGLDYRQEWASIEKALPTFGAQDDWSPSKRKKANAAALDIVAHVKGTVTGEQNRPLTTEEMIRRLNRLAKSGEVPKNWRDKLVAYSGQGGIGDSLNEYYTTPDVAAAMWKILSRLGLEQGHVLEPSAGAGVFQETKPRGITMTAVEWDAMSSLINQLLHPQDEVVHSALEDFVTADTAKYDAVIGNVPFGIRGAILANDKPNLKTAEEYFLDTALDKTKDGGVVALIVPHGVADNLSNRAYRDRILRKAEIITVHRLPNTAFEHSGTGVVTDILVLRKRPQDVAGALSILDKADLQAIGVSDPAWVDGKIIEDPSRSTLHGTAQANWRGGLDVTGTMDGVPALVATGTIRDAQLGPSYDDVLKHIADRPDLLKRSQGAAKKNPYPDLPTGTTRLIGGVLYMLQGEPRRWHRADEIGPGVDYASESKEGQALWLAGQIDKLAKLAREGRMSRDLGTIRDAVEQYVARYGNPGGDKVLAQMAQRDPRFLPLIAAVDGDGKPSPMLQGKMTAGPDVKIDVKNLDAVMAHLLGGDQRGWSVRDIATNWDGGEQEDAAGHEHETLAKLYASDQYAVTLDGDLWGSREDLVSGDLYPKLDALKLAVPSMPADSPLRHKLEQQIRWLDEALSPKSIEEFEISLRSGFVPTNMLSDFLTAKAKEGHEEKEIRIEVTYQDGVFSIKSVGKDDGYVNGLYEKYLNRLPLKEEQWKDIPDMEREYHAWLASSSHREELENIYNRLFNGYRAKRYGEQPVELEGWNPDRALNGYQHPALRWAQEVGRGIISYDVGVGKTPFGIALRQVLSQTGEAKRPLYVCPKSLTANWAAEIEAFRPGSSVLIIGETHTRDKNGKLKAVPDSKEERDKKWHQLMQSNFDYCLVTYPAFNDIDVDPLVKGGYIQSDFWVQRGKQLDQATPRHVREIEERYKQAMADKDFRKRTNALYWNDLGIDCLVVDEAHAFKNLFTARDRFGSKPKYLGGSGFAKRALDMQHKCRWVRDQNKNRGVYFLTATPTKNSPLEVYSMLSHIVPEAFDRLGIRNSEDFIDRYCEIQNEMVLGTDGEIGPAAVVKGFKNMNELRQVMNRYIYRKTAADVGLTIPAKDVHQHYVPMTEDQERIYAALREQARTMKDEQNADVHIFSIMDKMNKAALDPSLLDGGTLKDAKHLTSPKYVEAVQQVQAGLKDGGQIVFVDSIDAHQRFKQLLVGAGIPESEVGVINADVAPDSAKRQNVADDYVNGKLKVVIGNTATMGEGVNLQKFTSDIHHLDIPWDPSSIQQRDGRGVRQGNKLGAVRIHTYLSKKSFDGYRFQTCAGKKDWMDQLWHGGDRIENLAAEQGTIGRDDFLIMMADDPDKAREGLASNKALQLEKYTAMKVQEANQTYQTLVGLKRNYALLENKETKTAQALSQRIDRLTRHLSKDEHFPSKALLKLDKPVLLNQAGKGFYEGATFTMADRNKAPMRFGEDAKTWVVTGVNLDAQEVTMRPVGRFPSSDYMDPFHTCKIADLATGMEPTEPVSIVEEVKAAIPHIKNPKHLSIYPAPLIEAIEPQIQASFRARMRQPVDYEKDSSEWMKPLWAWNDRQRPTMINPGDERAKEADYILPIPAHERRLAELASKERKDNSLYRSASYGRRGSRHESRYFQDALNALVGWERAHALMAEYEASIKPPMEKAVSLVFGKAFPHHHGRPGLVGGSQPRHAPDTGQGSGNSQRQARAKREWVEGLIEQLNEAIKKRPMTFEEQETWLHDKMKKRGLTNEEIGAVLGVWLALRRLGH